MPNGLSRGVVLTISAQPLELPAPALRFLLRLRQLAGHARRLVTYTKSLATIFGRTTNTIRAWRNVLVDQGYIHWVTDRRTGQSSIYLTEKVEPPSRQALIQEQQRIDALPNPLPWQTPKPVVIPKDPPPWWKLPATSMFCLGGAKLFAPIKTSKILSPSELTSLAHKWGFPPV